jgi:hypothetical protein
VHRRIDVGWEWLAARKNECMEAVVSQPSRLSLELLTALGLRHPQIQSGSSAARPWVSSVGFFAEHSQPTAAEHLIPEVHPH